MFPIDDRWDLKRSIKKISLPCPLKMSLLHAHSKIYDMTLFLILDWTLWSVLKLTHPSSTITENFGSHFTRADWRSCSSPGWSKHYQQHSELFQDRSVDGSICMDLELCFVGQVHLSAIPKETWSKSRWILRKKKSVPLSLAEPQHSLPTNDMVKNYSDFTWSMIRLLSFREATSRKSSK